MILSFAILLSPFTPIAPLAPNASGAGFGSPAPGAGDAPPFTITIKDFTFTPRTLTIPAGSKVVWVNKDEEPHKIVEVNSLFTSKPLDTDDHFIFEFKSAGTYEFFCALHPRMTGKIIVETK
jgi:plastocyanin